MGLELHYKTGLLWDTISRGLSTTARESSLPMRQNAPRRTPIRYLAASIRANRICIFLEGDLEAVVAKGNFISHIETPRPGAVLRCNQGKLLSVKKLQSWVLYCHHYYYDYWRLDIPIVDGTNIRNWTYLLLRNKARRKLARRNKTDIKILVSSYKQGRWRHVRSEEAGLKTSKL